MTELKKIYLEVLKSRFQQAEETIGKLKTDL